MAKPLFTIEEVLVSMQVSGAPTRLIEALRTQLTGLLRARNQSELEIENEKTDGTDTVSVASTFGQRTQRGYVEFTLNEQRTQMEPKKAREIGLMLLEASEAAQSDEIFVRLLKNVGITDIEALGRILIDLRELRQGTRGTSWPT